MANPKYCIGDRFIFYVTEVGDGVDGDRNYRLDCRFWVAENVLDESREAFPEPMDAKHYHPVLPDSVYNLCLNRITELTKLVKQYEAERDALCDYLNVIDVEDV